MYIVKSKKKFNTSDDAIHFILSVIAEAGVEEEFEVIEIREDLCGRIKDLFASEDDISQEFMKLSHKLTDPVQKLNAQKLSKEYEYHKGRMYDLAKRLDCWEKKS